MDNDGYVELVNAIMAQAADDYRGALKLYKSTTEQLADLEKMAELPHAPAAIRDRIKDTENRRNGAIENMRQLEAFFLGRWTSTLTGGANMEYVIKKLKQECGINDIPRH